ncbi:MAG: hypothetical protein R6X32_09960 [Chloroflexota bacterium]
MQSRIRPLLFILLVITLLVALFFFLRRPTLADYGPAVTLCPGPDQYGYVCASGDGFAYISGQIDTMLYADDAVVSLDLPFPFTFYGTVYTQVTASSNGTLQFGSQNPAFANRCLDDGPVAGMGDMIAPYWDDLDLTVEGYLKTAVHGTAPDRVFVIEWERVPRYGVEPDSGQHITFAVQLFEGSSDIIFLYPDVTLLRDGNGRSATIGLQSENQGLALQYGCNQPVVADAGAVYFPHPDQPNAAIGQETVIEQGAVEPQALGAKGPAADLLAQLDPRQPQQLVRFQRHWLQQSQPRQSEWGWLDMTGDGRNELFITWYGRARQAHLTQLALLAPTEAGGTRLLWQQGPTNRSGDGPARLTIAATADLTHDGRADLLLHDTDNQRHWLLTSATGQIDLHAVPDQCAGAARILDLTDGRSALVRGDCGDNGRLTHVWEDGRFVQIQE